MLVGKLPREVEFIDFDEQRTALLLQGLDEKGIAVQRSTTHGDHHLVVCGGSEDLSFLTMIRNRRPNSPVLVVAKAPQSATNLIKLAELQVHCLDPETSIPQLVTTAANMLSFSSLKSDKLFPLMKRVDELGNGKNLFLVRRLGRTVETGFYWLRPEEGFNTCLSGGPFGNAMHVGQKLSFCLSSQAGCSLTSTNQACLHCLTGRGEFGGNLTAREIIEQFEMSRFDTPGAERIFPPKCVLHASFMGEGEPLDNLNNVLEAIRHLQDMHRWISFSLSTVGAAEGIKQLLAEDLSGISLQPQISLHYADKRREKFIPLAIGDNGLEHTFPLMLRLAKKLNHPLVVNVVMIGGPDDWQNNRAKDADRLINFLWIHDPSLESFRVKLSPFNGEGRGLQVRFQAGSPDEFKTQLLFHGIDPQIVKSMGTSKEAGCGNLVTRILSATRHA